MQEDFYMIDDDEYEDITTETLSEATVFLDRLNQSTVSIESFNNSGLDGLLDDSAQIRDQSRYEIAQNMLNSTVIDEIENKEDQVLPDFDERPVRKRTQTKPYVAKW